MRILPGNRYSIPTPIRREAAVVLPALRPFIADACIRNRPVNAPIIAQRALVVMVPRAGHAVELHHVSFFSLPLFLCDKGAWPGGHVTVLPNGFRSDNHRRAPDRWLDRTGRRPDIPR